MKRLIYILFICSSLCTTLQAQISFEDFEDGTAKYVFNNRTRLFKIALGFPSDLKEAKISDDYYYRLNRKLPDIYVERVTPLFSLKSGFVVGFNSQFSFHRYGVERDEEKVAIALKKGRIYSGEVGDGLKDMYRYSLGIGLSLHKSFSPKLECYVSVGTFCNYYTQGGSNPFSAFDGDMREHIFWLRSVAGVRYAFTDKFSVFAEGGYDTSLFRIGVAF